MCTFHKCLCVCDAPPSALTGLRPCLRRSPYHASSVFWWAFFLCVVVTCDRRSFPACLARVPASTSLQKSVLLKVPLDVPMVLTQSCSLSPAPFEQAVSEAEQHETEARSFVRTLTLLLYCWPRDEQHMLSLPPFLEVATLSSCNGGPRFPSPLPHTQHLSSPPRRGWTTFTLGQRHVCVRGGQAPRATRGRGGEGKIVPWVPWSSCL